MKIEKNYYFVYLFMFLYMWRKSLTLKTASAEDEQMAKTTPQVECDPNPSA